MAPSLSIFFPAYNDAGTIASLALIAHMTARQLTDDYEVIVVDDGSPDHTGELLDEMARHFSWLKVVHHAKNRGYGGALRTGFADRHQGPHLLHGRRRAVRPARADAPLRGPRRPRWTSSTATRSARSDPVAPHGHRPRLPLVRAHDVRPAPARRGLRLPPHAAGRVREGRAHPLLRRHLRRADEEGAGPRLPHRRGARPPLPPHLRQEPVLQRPARGPHAGRPHAPVVGAGGAQGAPARPGAAVPRRAQDAAAERRRRAR